MVLKSESVNSLLRRSVKNTKFDRFSPQYLTYGHAKARAKNGPLGAIDKELNFTVNCAMERDDTGPENKWQRIVGGLDKIVGPFPLYFQENPKWRAKRHQDLVDMITKDEEEYGRLGQG